jgi:lysophospholipid acyltransferase
MIQFIDAFFSFLAPYMGLPTDHLKLIFILYATVPLCGVLKRLPVNNRHYKNIFNIAYLHSYTFYVNYRISLFLLVGVFDLWTGLWTILISAIGTYVLTFQLKGPMMPWIVFAFVMGQMSISQLIRQIYRTPDDVIDYTGFSNLSHVFSNKIVLKWSLYKS